ncbi:ATP-dependent nuclease [Segatella asaccharophila]
MYISKVHINGFRGFRDSTIDFTEGLNAIIGHNNGGKSTVIDALRLVIDIDKKRHLSAWDFFQGAKLDKLKEESPYVEISVYIKESKDEDADSDDVALFTTYAIAVEPKLESCLTYRFYLPDSEKKSYTDDMKDAQTSSDLFHIIEKKYIRKYGYNIYGGPPELQRQAASADLRKIDFQFVGALRDVEQSMFSGHNDLLKDVLTYFLDYDLSPDKKKDDKGENNQNGDEAKEKEKNKSEKDKREKEFAEESKKVIEKVLDRIKDGTESITQYANDTGAILKGSKIKFDGEISESQLLQILQLLVESDELGYSLPVSQNGLGYNNLIYISLLLSKMQSSTSMDFMGENNVRSFPILAIEEPEAHLHPELQYQFLEFIRKNQSDGHVRQVFITTHSSSLAAKIKLDEFTCLYKDKNGIVTAYYPRAVFADDNMSRNYIQRYLDATRADMLFAGGIIFVEGMAEQILLPAFAKRLNLYEKWMKKQIVVVNIGGRYFENFLKLYDGRQKGTLPIKVACITDRDPVRKLKNSAQNAKWKSCWPIEYDADSEHYDYKNHSEDRVDEFKEHKNIRYFSQDSKGKTLEYEIARKNSHNANIIVDSLENKVELTTMINSKTLSETLEACNDSDLVELYRDNSIWREEDDRRQGVIASRYLESVSKGINALELSENLEQNSNINVPDYIEEAIKWVLN